MFCQLIEVLEQIVLADGLWTALPVNEFELRNAEIRFKVKFLTSIASSKRNVIDTHIRLEDKALNVYLTGGAGGNIPVTPGALNKRGKNGDVTVSKLVIMDDLALGISASPSSSVKHGSNLVYTLAVTSKGPDFGNNVRLDDPLPAGTTFLSLARNGGTCTTPAMGATGTVHCVIPQLNKGDTFIATLTVKVTASIGSTLSNSANARSDMQDFVPANNKAMFTSKVN